MRTKERESNSIPISSHPREKTPSSSSSAASHTKSIRISGKCALPTVIKYLLRAIEPWDKDATKEISIEAAAFEYAIDQLMLRDDISQVCKMEEIGVTIMTLYAR